MNPTVDRVIAVVAILPMLWAAYYRYEHYGLNLPVIYYFVNTMSNAVAIGALLFSVWARLSLRRNRGFVPAQREIVTAGAYRFVRHPIYTGLILSYLAVALRIYSPRNITLLAIAVFWMLVKSFVEESFLRADSQYAAYMTKVRARWIPFVI